MKRILVGTGCVVVLCGALVFAPTASRAKSGPTLLRDVDCSDFATQAAAQHYFNSHGSGDPAGLDGDGDGIACESNPCPCVKPGDGGGADHGGGAGGSHSGSSRLARVVSVTDGDTIKVITHGREEDIRLIGIDTPEVYFGEECGGAEASASMKSMLRPSDRVKLVRDRSQDNRDHYGRQLRYVELNGRDVGRRQLHRGWAQVYVFASPFNRVRSYRRQRDAAHRHKRGAWKLCGGDFHNPF